MCMFLVELWRYVLPTETNTVLFFFTRGATSSSDPPNRSSFTSLAAFSPSSRRFLSIILDLSAAALSSALTVQPMAPNTGAHTHKQKSASALRVSACQPMPRIPMKQPPSPAHCLIERGKQLIPEFVPTCKKSMLPFGSSICAQRRSRCTRIIRFINLRVLTLVHVQTFTALCSHPSTRGGVPARHHTCPAGLVGSAFRFDSSDIPQMTLRRLFSDIDVTRTTCRDSPIKTGESSTAARLE